ncbi:MAG: PilZ domain-containing protein [Nitratireductor sp.]|nr:PilZ domain-containing protein [Nitratireductor sp.]
MRAIATGQGPAPGQFEDVTEKRAFPRDPARDLSEIILDGSKYGVACLIHDLSPAGAKLEVSCGELPKRFILANYTKQTRTVCRLVWRSGNMIGVSFLTKPRHFEFSGRL